MSSLFQGLVQWIRGVFEWIASSGDTLIVWVLNNGAGYFPAVNWSSYQTVLDEANYLFPVSEIVTFSVALAALWCVVAGYRLVKSWIPTVSGT